MKPTAYISTVLGLPDSSDGERTAYNFDLVSRYFYNDSSDENSFQVIDAETTADLDLNTVFERIDRTTSKVGQQYLYSKLRTLRGEDEVKGFGGRADRFSEDPELTGRCRGHMARLAGDDAYDLQNLIFDKPAEVRNIALVYLLSFAAVAALLLSPFYPLLLLLFLAIFAANLYIHYSNKLSISLYASAVKQLSLALKTARYLTVEEVPGTQEAKDDIRQVAEVERRSRVVGTQGDGGNELAAIGWLLFELVKVAFNIEVILFHRFIGSIVAKREAIHNLFRYIGETDAAISVAQLRTEVRTCRPEFVEGKYLKAEQVVHPLIDDCVPNTLVLDGTGLLLTGSNMSGKTTFIRTLMLNALLAETIDTCFAAAFSAPYMKIYSSIRISDDITEGTSYYLQEVLTVKRLLDAAQGAQPCLFARDELFKGTNTTERIAAGKAVLAHLNRGPHIVLVSTHDIELAELLYRDGYELHHFREEVVDGKLVFDYQLHTGPLTTRNAIRILELYDYPPELIAEAYGVQEQLMQKAD
ncbi:DNA mismatch repair protein MutS [uncultured Alistipes sp.]|uniref:MutS-related protein n=1 Tax=uncultured Alistipes sp. TaxID=538949 RepID=UPI0027D9A160|nr:DNA mismatch repair protein MutS [uncultured Alistipes sp.]